MSLWPHLERAGSSPRSLTRLLILFVRPKPPLLTPPSDTITLGLRVSHVSLGDADIQFLAETSASHKMTEKSRVKGPSFENLANEISLSV